MVKPDLDSRHVRERGISTSARNARRTGEWDSEDERVNRSENIEELQEEGTDGEGEGEREGTSEGGEGAEVVGPVMPRVRVPRAPRHGPDGRFVPAEGAEGEEGASSTNKKRRRRKVPQPWLVDGEMGGGPRDGSMIPSYRAHVACALWGGVDREFLNVVNRSARCRDLQTWSERMSLPVRHLIADTGLGHLPGIMYRHIDAALISAFVERWQPDTNTFHLPFGEMTVMLHDVAYILGLPLEGKAIGPTLLSPAQLKGKFWELLRVDMDSKLKNLRGSWYKAGGVEIQGLVLALRRMGDCLKMKPRAILLQFWVAHSFRTRVGAC